LFVDYQSLKYSSLAVKNSRKSINPLWTADFKVYANVHLSVTV